MDYFFEWQLLHKSGELINSHKKDIYQTLKACLYGNVMDYIAHNQIIFSILFMMMAAKNTYIFPR